MKNKHKINDATHDATLDAIRDVTYNATNVAIQDVIYNATYIASHGKTYNFTDASIWDGVWIALHEDLSDEK